MFQILIVEDDKELSQLFQKVLEKNGYQVKSASDGAQVLEVLDNAIKFSPAKGTITMFLKQEQDSVRFILEDEGSGIWWMQICCRASNAEYILWR